ncbi:hypothetical protein B0T10DRAFT_186934 [Thelonectria olida]|uniref:Secreted protein n=1 Tax=Thelonectria olida TaxID=1576542 RepID=A0A9P8WHA2_9HYPO|nr:hypothetical protein B0T10DRAFT_186934 [Thelonectria olida]
MLGNLVVLASFLFFFLVCRPHPTLAPPFSLSQAGEAPLRPPPPPPLNKNKVVFCDRRMHVVVVLVGKSGKQSPSEAFARPSSVKLSLLVAQRMHLLRPSRRSQSVSRRPKFLVLAFHMASTSSAAHGNGKSAVKGGDNKSIHVHAPPPFRDGFLSSSSGSPPHRLSSPT